ncbi:TRAP transporter substrate-binding protein [Roseovarius indicus]|uniref:TRAP transporter substrate-binding protein n=1 Tax=Roseovarius indicus TaxID=540747 RepID=UPI0007D917DF|nr:TRAP transporter substrate-binding protein [Roseovarius indicus]OAO07171.1 hypothetical protein A8B76_02400 [Roseovarius indicus]
MNIRARTFAITALVAGSIAGSAVAQDTVTIPLATWGGSEHVGVRQFVPAFEEALKEEAPERVEFQHFPGGQIAQDRDMPVGIPSGQVKLGWITVNGWTGTVPDTRLMDAPTGLTMAQLDTLLDDKGLFDALAGKFEEKNTVLLGLADLGPPCIVSNEKILSPDDLAGKKVRVFSEGQAAAIRSFGGSPVTLPFADVYSAMQYGTIEAAVVGFQGVQSQKLYEVSDHVLVPASFLGTTMMGWAANKQWFDGLPDDVREGLSEAMDQASHSNREAIVGEIDEITADYRDAGMEVTFLEPEMPEFEQWQSATKPLLDDVTGQLSPDIVEIVTN